VLKFSRYLALILGIIAPALETYRRWSSWQNDPASFFDDYLLGGLLLLGAWRVTKNAATGQKYLTLAWGCALGMVYGSFFHQLHMAGTNESDPSGFSNEWAIAVKGLGFILIIVGLITSLVKITEDS
jgi:hypothetical protein